MEGSCVARWWGKPALGRWLALAEEGLGSFTGVFSEKWSEGPAPSKGGVGGAA